MAFFFSIFSAELPSVCSFSLERQRRKVLNFPTLKTDANAAEVYNAKSVLCCGFQCLKFVNALALDWCAEIHFAAEA